MKITNTKKEKIKVNSPYITISHNDRLLIFNDRRKCLLALEALLAADELKSLSEEIVFAPNEKFPKEPNEKIRGTINILIKRQAIVNPEIEDLWSVKYKTLLSTVYEAYKAVTPMYKRHNLRIRVEILLLKKLGISKEDLNVLEKTGEIIDFYEAKARLF